jgi:hypothetical protein
MLREVMKADKVTLMKLYKERQAEPDNADEMWEPMEKNFI